MQLEDLKKAGLPAKPEDAKKMIDLLDRDHDGRVSFDEFQRYLCLLPAAQVWLGWSGLHPCTSAVRFASALAGLGISCCPGMLSQCHKKQQDSGRGMALRASHCRALAVPPHR